MYKQSKLYFLIFFFFLFSIYHLAFIIPPVAAQVPGLHQPACGEHQDPEFHSLRPYQAAPCGDAPKAYFCSNDLIFIESFDMAGTSEGGEANDSCEPRHAKEEGTWDFTCTPDGDNYPSGGVIPKHTLTVTLDDSMFPIMGNTEDQMDDATKVNNYMSWYLSGVSNKKETGIPTDDQIVNYSGPVNKLIPSMIQDAERIKTIESVTKTVKYRPEGKTIEIEEPENHDQVVVCAQEGIFGIWGKTYPEPCDGGEKYRLTNWKGDLSLLRSALISIGNFIPSFIKDSPFGNVVSSLTGDQSAWNKRTPPLPWDDGTVEKPTEDNPVKPFASDILYKKAYNEWQGKSCAIVPIIGLSCVDNPLVKNKWAELYHYIPLSNNIDKTGAEYIIGDGPSYTPDAGTQIGHATHDDIKNAPLYMAHTKEVDDLSQLLNKTYTPQECKIVDGEKKCFPMENKPVPKTTEYNNCSALTVRTNKGDNLFPGDPHELQVIGVTYPITQATCHETWKKTEEYVCPKGDKPDGDPKDCKWVEKWKHTFKCPAEITIKISTGTKTTYADPIYSRTVADSGSTFRKIYPKVEKGAPVSCIADIPTITDVTYTAEDALLAGDWKFKVKRYPEDGAGEGPQLTFPHIGSMYEYFLNGIQTALRPKGYGEQPISGEFCIECGKLPMLTKSSGSCSLGEISSRIGDIPQSLKDIIESAAETYKTPPNLILAVMFGEGLFNTNAKGDKEDRFSKIPWSENNVKMWATCTPVPNCNDGEGDDNFMGFYPSVWKNVANAIKPDLLKLDPNRKKEPSRCNLLDAVYGVAWNLHDSADGGMNFQCFGLDLTAPIPSSCEWKDNQYVSAIKISENGFESQCFTREGGCAQGNVNLSDGSSAVACPTGDTCETISNRLSTNQSHMGCVWDVAHGN